jgi:hypothetical protein
MARLRGCCGELSFMVAGYVRPCESYVGKSRAVLLPLPSEGEGWGEGACVFSCIN